MSISTEMRLPLHDLLQERGLGHWFEVVVDFASRFDGWRSHYYADDTLEPDHEPIEQVMVAIRAVPVLELCDAATPSHRDIKFRELACAVSLSRVEMTRWHALVETPYPNAWNPLEQPFLKFSQLQGRLQTFPDDKTPWPACVVQTWLLGRVKEQEIQAAVSVNC